MSENQIRKMVKEIKGPERLKLTNEQIKLFRALVSILKLFEWDIAFPACDEEQLLKGMIIGEESYINYILRELPD